MYINNRDHLVAYKVERLKQLAIEEIVLCKREVINFVLEERDGGEPEVAFMTCDGAVFRTGLEPDAGSLFCAVDGSHGNKLSFWKDFQAIGGSYWAFGYLEYGELTLVSRIDMISKVNNHLIIPEFTHPIFIEVGRTILVFAISSNKQATIRFWSAGRFFPDESSCLKFPLGGEDWGLMQAHRNVTVSKQHQSILVVKNDESVLFSAW